MKIEPTIRERAGTLDFLRGLAILGILMANVESFAGPVLDSMDVSGASEWWDALEAAFVSGKFRSMLAILFGVGLWAQFKKREQDSKTWPGGYVKRNLVLAAIGLCHAMFIWPGDILVAYGFTAIVATAFVRSSDTVLWRIVIGGSLFMSFCGIGCAAIMSAPNFMGEVASSPGSNPFQMPSWEADAVASGSALRILGTRIGVGLVGVTNSSALIVLALPLFLFGILLGRSGVLSQPSAHPEMTKKMLLFGWLVGGLTNFPVLATMFTGNALGPQLAIDFGMSPYLAVAYLITGAIIAEKLGRVLNPFRAAGRLALSNYLLQSLVMNHLFLVMGWYGKATPVQITCAVLGMWTLNVLFSVLWLRKFDIGPVEWLLRSATEGTKLPWRYAHTADVSVVTIEAESDEEQKPVED